MKTSTIKIAIAIAALIIAALPASAQQPATGDTIIIDRIVAVVGNSPVLESAIESQYFQAKARNVQTNKCKIYEDMLYQKLLVSQADIDSLTVTEKQVDAEIQSRLQGFINQLGGLEKVEEYFNKPLGEIKEDLRAVTEDQLLAQMERDEITKDIKVTPSEVNNFYRHLPKDSLPLIDLEFELNQIVFYPTISKKDIEDVKKRLRDIKDEVEHKGAMFETKAILYSEDPVSAAAGGELGFMQRDELVPEFSAAAFKLKRDSISDIIKTEYGYHIIQMIDRKGERINVRHILLKPKFTPEAKQRAKQLADSVYNVIKEGKITFEDAARLYSQDEKTNKNGGLLMNAHTGSTKFQVDDIFPTNYYNIKNLKEGEYTRAFESYDSKGETIFIIIKVKSKVEPHIAHIETDYQVIQDMALDKKYRETYDKWVAEKSQSTYIKISNDYKNCPFEYDGWLHNELKR
ncbi:MAG: peptidylprolyl isomerase [Bacteroidales bacterium]|nr:peptidylprolyl isomerase [Bacteroidales bacterium]